MPFAECRGGGKLAVNVRTMEGRWEAEWAIADSGTDVSHMTANENWPLIRQSIPVGRVLEAGCGIARWVAFLDSAGYETYGLDYSLAAFEKSLARWPNLRLSQGDLRAMPYNDGFFDGIVSFGAIEHDIKGWYPGKTALTVRDGLGTCLARGEGGVLTTAGVETNFPHYSEAS